MTLRACLAEDRGVDPQDVVDILNQLAAAEAELLAVCESLSMVNYADGQGGYERPNAETICHLIREMRAENDRYRDALERFASSDVDDDFDGIASKALGTGEGT